jgi:hypothetical protein
LLTKGLKRHHYLVFKEQAGLSNLRYPQEDVKRIINDIHPRENQAI